MIVLDTSFFVAYRNERDVHHARARDAWPRVLDAAPVLLHEYALAEMAAVLVRKLGPEAAALHTAPLLDAVEVEFVPASPGFRAVWQRFQAQRGTRHSLADLALLQLAEDRGAPAIATFDEEFRKAKGLAVVP
jgi:predicted nucleic acid-binding protein